MNYDRRIYKLEKLAYHDSLTGLLNRSWLYENKKNIKSKYVYFIDINNLRLINRGGHRKGDKYILDIVKSIKLNTNEILLRYAGDEFVLFSNNKNKLKLNNKYSFGMSVVSGGVMQSINNADREMIKNKYE